MSPLFNNRAHDIRVCACLCVACVLVSSNDELSELKQLYTVASPFSPLPSRSDCASLYTAMLSLWHDTSLMRKLLLRADLDAHVFLPLPSSSSSLQLPVDPQHAAIHDGIKLKLSSYKFLRSMAGTTFTLRNGFIHSIGELPHADAAPQDQYVVSDAQCVDEIDLLNRVADDAQGPWTPSNHMMHEFLCDSIAADNELHFFFVGICAAVILKVAEWAALQEFIRTLDHSSRELACSLYDELRRFSVGMLANPLIYGRVLLMGGEENKEQEANAGKPATGAAASPSHGDEVPSSPIEGSVLSPAY
jgi:hypothetical protein